MRRVDVRRRLFAVRFDLPNDCYIHTVRAFCMPRPPPNWHANAPHFPPIPDRRIHSHAGSEDGAIKRVDAKSLKPDWQCNIAAAASHVDCLAANPCHPRHLAAALSDQRNMDNAVVAHFDVRSGKHGARCPAVVLVVSPGRRQVQYS